MNYRIQILIAIIILGLLAQDIFIRILVLISCMFYLTTVIRYRAKLLISYIPVILMFLFRRKIYVKKYRRDI